MDNSKTRINTGSSCFDKAAENQIYRFPDYLVCHGVVRSPTHYFYHVHAWNEKDDTVYDFTNAVNKNDIALSMPKDRYYFLGQIVPEWVIRYDMHEVMKHIGDAWDYGPWEPIFLQLMKEVNREVPRLNNLLITHDSEFMFREAEKFGKRQYKDIHVAFERRRNES